MSKRLKRRIIDISGLTNLSREEQVRRATAILADSEFKQKICNQIVGASHKDVEKALKAIATIKVSKEDAERIELEEECPEKLNPEWQPRRNKKNIKLKPLIDKKEVKKLIEATSKPLETQEIDRGSYASYSKREVEDLLSGNARVRQDQK